MIIYRLIFALLVLLGSTLYGQAPRFESYKILKNTSGMQVNAIEQDAQRYIWFGTNKGLIKYDGVDFIQYTEQDSLYNNEISSLSYDHLNNCLWIGHKDGKISQKKHENILKFNPEEGLPMYTIASIFIDSNNVPWFCTLGEGVYLFKGQKRKRLYNLNTDDGLLDNYVYEIAQQNDSIFYFATDKGISVYNSYAKEFTSSITTKNGLPDNLVKSITIENSHLWIGMHDGGVCNYNTVDQTFSHFSQWNFGSLNNINVAHENEIYVSTSKKGVVKIIYDENCNAWYSLYNKNHGLNDVRTNVVYYDFEHNIWVGTRKGISLRKDNNIEFFNSNSGFDLKQIYSITTDTLNRFWLATETGLYLHYYNEMGKSTTKKVLDKPEFQNALFINVYNDNKGNVWAGTYGFGAICINPVTFDYKVINTNTGLSSNDVFQITGDSLNIWLSTAGGGVNKLSITDLTSIQQFTSEHGLPSDYVFSVFIEEPNKVWLATDGGGVATIEEGKVHLKNFDLINKLGNKVYSVCTDELGKLWFNVGEHGIVVYDGTTEHHLNEMNGLSTNNIQSLIWNGNNKVIASSNQGIDIINTSNYSVEKYGEAAGVSYQEPNLNAIYRNKENHIFIGTAKGILKKSSKIYDTLIKPKLFLTSKRLFSSAIDSNENKFNHKQNNFTFTYTAIWFKSQSPLTYRYKLIGYDINWSPETSIRSVTYPKLPDGKYTFTVQAKLPNGNWIESEEGTYSFKIKPPFWKTPLFIAFAIIMLFVGIYTFINYRTRKLKRDKEVLELEVQKRTAEIRQQKEEIESQRDEIEAQRNHVVEQHARIKAQHKDIQASITYASRIQKAVLPPFDHFDKLLKEYFVFFKPRDIVSGDFYYLNTCHGKTVVAAADCTGHGVPGAFMSLLGVSLLDQILSHLNEDFDAATVLNKLRTEIKKALRQTGKEDTTKDGMDISLSVIDFKNQKLDFAGAFNPLLVIRNKEIIEYKGDKMPIGVFMKDSIDFTNHSIILEPNDILYMYSDGFQDQFGGDNNRKFLPKNLRNLLLENSTKSMQEQHDMLDITLAGWKGKNNQVDDILVIGIKV